MPRRNVSTRVAAADKNLVLNARERRHCDVALLRPRTFPDGEQKTFAGREDLGPPMTDLTSVAIEPRDFFGCSTRRRHRPHAGKARRNEVVG